MACLSVSADARRLLSVSAEVRRVLSVSVEVQRVDRLHDVAVVGHETVWRNALCMSTGCMTWR